MEKLNRQDLWSLEEYAIHRIDFRTRIMAHKKALSLDLGPHLRLLFEDRLTVQYQVQEMLRIERLFEAEAIQEELDAYNPLIPDGQNWKATLMLEYPDVEQRHRCLAELVGMEHRIWVQVDGGKPIFAIADEDLERSDGVKTSSVHFLRWQLDSGTIQAALRPGAQIVFGCDHPRLRIASDPVDAKHRNALQSCLDEVRSH